MGKTTTEETKHDEGPRSFAYVLQQIGDGDLHDELGLELQKLVGRAFALALVPVGEVRALLTLKLSIKAMANGAIAVAGDFSSKAPTAPKAGSVFYATKGNNLTLENPRQQKLPLKEVPQPKTQVKELAEDRPVRGV